MPAGLLLGQLFETTALCCAGCKTSGLTSNTLGLSAVWRHMLQEVADNVVFESSFSGELPVLKASCIAAEQSQEPGKSKEAG